MVPIQILETLVNPVPWFTQSIPGCVKVVYQNFYCIFRGSGCDGDFLHGESILKPKASLCFMLENNSFSGLSMDTWDTPLIVSTLHIFSYFETRDKHIYTFSISVLV